MEENEEKWKRRLNSPHIAHSISGLCNAVGNEAEDVGESEDKGEHVGEAGKEQVEDGLEVLVPLRGVLQDKGGHQACQVADKESSQWGGDEGKENIDIGDNLDRKLPC